MTITNKSAVPGFRNFRKRINAMKIKRRLKPTEGIRAAISLTPRDLKAKVTMYVKGSDRVYSPIRGI